MSIASTEIEKVLNQLETGPQRILAATSAADSTRLYQRPDPESWSVNEILAHLRACGDVWGKSIQAMITQDHPTMRYVSPRTWIRKTKYLEQEFRPSFDAFTKQRNDLVATLKALEIEGWSRPATFTGTTRGRNQTVLSYAQRIVEHETPHLDEIESLLSSVKVRNQP